MTNTVLAIIIGLVLVVAVAGIWAYMARRRAALRARFGPEYEHVVTAAGDARRAEADLAARAKRVSHYEIKPLTPDRSRFFTEAWRRVQAMFVDNPSAAVADADSLVTDLMTARGYPMSEFDRRVEDLSVDHASVVQHYREAHDIAERQARRAATTEDLRQAVIHYRALFEDLLEVAGEPNPARG